MLQEGRLPRSRTTRVMQTSHDQCPFLHWRAFRPTGISKQTEHSSMAFICEAALRRSSGVRYIRRKEQTRALRVVTEGREGRKALGRLRNLLSCDGSVDGMYTTYTTYITYTMFRQSHVFPNLSEPGFANRLRTCPEQASNRPVRKGRFYEQAANRLRTDV